MNIQNMPDLPVRLSDEIIRPLEDVRNERVKLAVDYWNALRGQRQMPARNEITLRGMARFVSDSVLVEVLHGGADYAFGFMGDSMVRAFNVSLTGRKMSDIEAVLPIFGGQLRELYAEAVHGRAFLARGNFQGKMHAISHTHETALLPLGEDGKVDHILIVGVQVPFHYWAKRSATKLRALAQPG